MQARDEIVYYLIDNPLKDEKIVIFNRDKMPEALNQRKEGMKIKKVLRVSKKETGQEDRLLDAEKFLINEYHEARERSRSSAIFLFFAGLTISYLLFSFLFNLGYLPLTSFLIRNFKTLTPELVNRYADLGAQLVAPILGIILGLSPLILGVIVMRKEIKKAGKCKEYAKFVGDLAECELVAVEDESSSSFYEDSKDLVRGTREQAENLRNSQGRSDKIESCRKIRGYLEKLSALTVLHKLDEVTDYYHRLNVSFYNLETSLKNPRFWRNDERYMKQTLGDFEITHYGPPVNRRRKAEVPKNVRKLTVLKVLLGVAILFGAIFYSGFYTVNKNETAVVVEYRFNELVSEPFIELIKGNLTNFRADLIAIINQERSGGNTRIIKYDDSPVLPFLTPFGKLYWHLPPPFGKQYKMSFETHEFHLKVPLIFTVATDQEGRDLMYFALTPDADGNPLTKDLGFRYISVQDLFEIQFSPETKLAVMMLDVKGRFNITSLEDYALWMKNSYGKMDQRIKESGFYGEIAGDPRGDELIEAYLSSILGTYLWQERYPIIFQKGQQKYPELSPQALEPAVANFMVENPRTLTDGFVEALSSQDFIKKIGVDLQKGAGINVLEGITTEMSEGFL